VSEQILNGTSQYMPFTLIHAAKNATEDILKQESPADWIGLSSVLCPPPTQYRLYGRRFLQVKRPNQQYQSTEGTYSTQTNQTYNKQT